MNVLTLCMILYHCGQFDHPVFVWQMHYWVETILIALLMCVNQKCMIQMVYKTSIVSYKNEQCF